MFWEKYEELDPATDNCENDGSVAEARLSNDDENNSATNTLEGCAQTCYDNPDCQSFNFGKNDRANDCQTFSTISCSDNSNWTFYRIIREGKPFRFPTTHTHRGNLV